MTHHDDGDGVDLIKEIKTIEVSSVYSLFQCGNI